MDIAVLDDGRWFDADAAKTWDGRKRESRTWLHRTRKAAYVLEVWPDKGGPREFSMLDRRTAFAWLLRNGYHNAVDEKFVTANEI